MMEIIFLVVFLVVAVCILGGIRANHSWTTVSPVETRVHTYIDEDGNEVTETTVVEQVNEYHEEW